MRPRSIVSAEKITEGLAIQIPVILFNGTFLLEHDSQKVICGNYFDDSIHEVFETLFFHGIYPFVSARIDGVEKVSFIEETFTRGMQIFQESRTGDRRMRPVRTTGQLTAGDCFYLTCIDEPEKLEPLYERYRERYHMVYHRDIYSGEQWLEFMPQTASKSNAALQLKRLLECDRLVVFGDGMYFTIVDVVVQPEYQGMGIGTKIVRMLVLYAESMTPAGGRSSISLIAEKGKEAFYETMGFKKLPHEFCGSGMRKVIYGKERGPI